LSSVISDNGNDRSLFVQELLKEIRVPDLMAEETLNRTRVGVTRASRGEQVPWISSSLAEDFSFIPAANAKGPGPVAALPKPAEPPPLPRVDPQPPVVSKPPPADKPVVDKTLVDKPAADKPAAAVADKPAAPTADKPAEKN